MESLNKRIGTNVLVSEDVLDQLDGFLIRRLGKFVLAGKSKPIAICELICQLDQCNQKQKTLRSVFASGLDAYQRKSWEDAMLFFQKATEIFGQDGPSRFYLRLCEDNRSKSLSNDWDGTVYLNSK